MKSKTIPEGALAFGFLGYAIAGLFLGYAPLWGMPFAVAVALTGAGVRVWGKTVTWFVFGAAAGRVACAVSAGNFGVVAVVVAWVWAWVWAWFVFEAIGGVIAGGMAWAIAGVLLAVVGGGVVLALAIAWGVGGG